MHSLRQLFILLLAFILRRLQNDNHLITLLELTLELLALLRNHNEAVLDLELPSLLVS